MTGKMIRFALVMSVMPLLEIVVGCGNHLHGRLDRMKTELARLPSFVQQNRWPEKSFYVSLDEQMSELTPEERQKAFMFFEVLLETPNLNDTDLAQRLQSLEIHLDIVKTVVAIFAKGLGNPAAAWEFLLSSIEIFDQEREDVSASTYNPHIPVSGICLDKALYLFNLETMRTKTISEWFEHGAFCRFYWNLPSDMQREWLSWLDFMAKRKLDLPNPDNPQQKVADSFFRLPPKVPRRVVEKRKRMQSKHGNLSNVPEIPSDADL